MGLAKAAVSALLALAFATALAADDAALAEQVERGKQIFTSGETASGTPITAIVSRGATPIPASILPCAGCHGLDGRGRPEGGVVPSDITWSSLTAPHGHEHQYGRKHPAFDSTTVAGAILHGIDPAGNALDNTMPRYRMSDDDMADLIAYLGQIEADLDAGLSDDTIRVGSLLPVAGSLAAVGRAMQQVLEAVFADVNDSGGIHGRRLELVVARYGDDPLDSVWQARDLLQRDAVFAMVGGYFAEVEEAMATAAEELEVPMIGPFTQLPRQGEGLERHSFYLSSGLVEQARALARHVSATGERAGRLAIVAPATGRAYQHAVAEVIDGLAALGAPEPLTISYSAPYFDPAAAAEALQDERIVSVLFLAPAAELKRFAAAASARSLAPDLLLPGLFADNRMFEIDPAYAGRVLVGYATTPADHSPAGIEAFEALHERHGIGYDYSSAQIAAFVSARVFIEGLKRSGRALSREKLLLALESLSNFEVGLMPPISYSRTRRIGAYGAHVLELDIANHRFGASRGWVPL